MSKTAAVSTRQELYPKGGCRRARGRCVWGSALSGLGLGDSEKGFSIEQIRDRLKSRYPEAEPLPNRPELDEFLHRVGLDVRWNTETRAYFIVKEAAILVTSGSSMSERHSTATSTRHVEVTPDIAEARQFEERLRDAYSEGGFLVLTVRPSRMRRCEDELLRRFRLQRVSFDDLLFDALREEAKDLEVDWTIIEHADGRDHSSQDWQNLLHLVGRVTPKIATDLMSRQEHLLLVHPGLIARYDQMAMLETLRDKVGHDSACLGLWVLVATDEQNDMPLFGSRRNSAHHDCAQRAKVSEGWIDNAAAPWPAAEKLPPRNWPARRGRLSMVKIKAVLANLQELVGELAEDLPGHAAAENAEIDAGLRAGVQSDTERGWPDRPSLRGLPCEDYLDQVAVARGVLACVFVAVHGG